MTFVFALRVWRLLWQEKRAKAQEAQGATVEALAHGGADIERGLSGRRTPLWLAAAHGHTAAVAALAKRGANLRCCAEGCGLSPLLVACQRGRAEVVSLLLELGVSTHRRFHASTPV